MVVEEFLTLGWSALTLLAKYSAKRTSRYHLKPQFVEVDFTIDLGYAADTGQQLVIPADLKFCQGPRLPEHSWARLFHEALGDQVQLDFPCGKDASPVATALLARFSNTAEQYIMAVDPGAEEGMRGRCWKMTTKLTTGALSCAPDHHFRNPALLAWESWTSNLRLCSAHLKHGKEHLVDGALAKLAEDSQPPK